MPGSRRTPDGTLLQWRTAVARASGLEVAPFFIEWSPDTVHPSATASAGCMLRSLDVAHPDLTPLQTLFSTAGFRQTLRSGKAPAIKMVLDCPKGLVTFSN